MQRVLVAGGGLAGSEAAWQLARSGIPVLLYEMRPERSTAAHRTGALAELVCSNSLKTDQEPSAPWLLKQDLRLLDSLLMRVAANSRVPGGHALTVDRDAFAEGVTSAISAEPLIEVGREELQSLPAGQISIIATGPLTSESLAAEIARLTGTGRLFFYDSISPIVEADSVDRNVAFAG